MNLSLAPNPTDNKLNLQYLASKDQPVSIQLLDMTGRQVLVLESNLVEGLNVIPMEVGPRPRTLSSYLENIRRNLSKSAGNCPITFSI